MESLLKSVNDFVRDVPQARVNSIAAKVSSLTSQQLAKTPHDWLTTAHSKTRFDRVISAWKCSGISGRELAGLLRGASYSYHVAKREVEVELIWTGPKTPLMATRRTEQALLEVIDFAKSSLFLTSFVAYKVPSIVLAIEHAIQRGVKVSILLESSDQHGGTITIDAIGEMRKHLPGVNLYYWAIKENEFEGAKVHAKVAVADGVKCFISSANLTGHAMEKNMEAGVIVDGGSTPKHLHRHLNALVETNVIEIVNR
ncbi:DISARM system phospholipase D-like protein DrmC [Microbulbifer sp. HZ11]|uniref:DISARM system phospholipase D-like protein DrmC n=1 Tax=Microbulbifer sp. HZ11 TaxID=1453501 RepID=UPI0005B99DE6|nr:DISARM system phospholipase D-like protein DrmC [Microbulbifer sp. HZ11]